MIPISEIARERGLDEKDAIEFLHDFLDYTEKEDLEHLKKGLEERDCRKVRISAHSIKGAALNLTLREIAEYAERIEKKSSAQDLEGVSELVNDLVENLHAVRDVLKDGE